MLADCHTHLDQFPPGELGPVLERARGAGVAAIVVAGTTVESSEAAVALAASHPMLFAGVGLHPSELRPPLDGETWQRLADLAGSSPRVVAVSEVGLDFAPSSPPLAIQYQALREQVRMARGLRLPVVFHSREAPGRPELHRETLRVLREERVWEVGGAMHYFQAGLDIARECLDLGLLVSLAKPLLRTPSLQEVAAQLPLASILLETDSYPQPFKAHRGLWTEPRDVRLVARKLAEAKGLEMEEVESATTENLLKLVERAGSPGPLRMLTEALCPSPGRRPIAGPQTGDTPGGP